MLSAIVLVCDAAQPRPATPEAIVASLSALVPAVIAGILNEASVAVTAGDEATRKIADHAGCRVVEASSAAEVLAAALAAARGPHLLLLRAGCVPGQGFIEELADFLRSAADQSAVLRQMPASGLARLFPSLAPVAGLVGSQARMQAAGRHSLAALTRGLGPRRTLRCGALMMA